MLPMMFNLFDEFAPMYNVHAASPAMNVTESNADYKLDLAVPGATKEDYKISLTEDGNLMVSLEKQNREEKKSEDSRHYLRREFSYQKFSEAFTLPEDVERNEIAAAVNNGVLTITLPKKAKEEAPACRQIEIK